MNGLPRTLWVLLPLIVGTGCSPSDASAPGSSPGGGDPSTGSTSSSMSSTGSTAAAGSTTASGSSSSGGGGDTTVTLKMASFPVPSGMEIYKCQDFANPFGGVDAEVSEFESHMVEGSHHLLLFYKDGATDSALEDCSGLEFAATPYATQLPDDVTTFPAGVAALIPKTTGLRLQSHYLNTTANDLTAEVTMTFHLAKSGTVTAHAGVLFVIDSAIQIAPETTGTVKYDCALPSDMNIIKATSHMHQHGTAFDASIAGQTIFSTTMWSDPAPALFNPAKLVHAGDPLSFSCTFVNNSMSELTFGESAQSNEMCIFVASYYPIPDGGSATVGCQ